MQKMGDESSSRSSKASLDPNELFLYVWYSAVDPSTFRRFLTEQDKLVAAKPSQEVEAYGKQCGAYTFIITPLSVGTRVIVRNNITGNEVDVSSWY